MVHPPRRVWRCVPGSSAVNDIEAVARSLRDVEFPVGSEQVLSTITGQGRSGRWSLTVSAVSDPENRFAHFTWAPEVGWTRINGTPVDIQTAVLVWWQHQTGLHGGEVDDAVQ